MSTWYENSPSDALLSFLLLERCTLFGLTAESALILVGKIHRIIAVKLTQPVISNPPGF